jgi:hypothetical protein
MVGIPAGFRLSVSEEDFSGAEEDFSGAEEDFSGLRSFQ